MLVSIVALGTATGSAKAASRIPTTTTLGSSSGAVQAGDTVTLTATVRPGVFVTGLGTVSFTDMTTGTSLGKARPASRCLLKIAPCAMTLAVPASSLAAGSNTISGTYSGDFLEAPSTGTVPVSYDSYDVEDQTTTQCGDTGACATGTQTGPDGETSLNINAASGPGATITTAFSTTPLPCSTPGVGSTLEDVAVFSATGLLSNKLVTITVGGSSAFTLNSDYGQTPHICYDEPAPFVTDGGAPAAPDGSGGYYGLLPPCVFGPSGNVGSATNPPCTDDAETEYAPTVGTIYVTQFETTATDPRASH